MPLPSMDFGDREKGCALQGAEHGRTVSEASVAHQLPRRPPRVPTFADLASMSGSTRYASGDVSDSLGEETGRSRSVMRSSPLTGGKGGKLNKRKKVRRSDGESPLVARPRISRRNGRGFDGDLETGDGYYSADKLKDKYRKRRPKRHGLCGSVFCCVCGCVPCLRPKVLALLGVLVLGAHVLHLSPPIPPALEIFRAPLEQLGAGDLGAFAPLVEQLTGAGPVAVQAAGKVGPEALFRPEEEQDEGFFGWLQGLGMELPIGLSVAERDRLRAEYAELYEQLQAAKAEAEKARTAAEEERQRAVRAEKAQEDGDGFAKSLDNELNAVNLKLLAAKQQLSEARRRADEDMQESLAKEQRLQDAIGQYEAVVKKLQIIQEPSDATAELGGIGAIPDARALGNDDGSGSRAPAPPRGRQIVGALGELNFSDHIAEDLAAHPKLHTEMSTFHVIPASALNSQRHAEELLDEDEVTWVFAHTGVVLLKSAHHYQFVDSAFAAAKRALFAMEEEASVTISPVTGEGACQIRLSSKTGLLLGLSPPQSEMSGCEASREVILEFGAHAQVAPPRVAAPSDGGAAADSSRSNAGGNALGEVEAEGASAEEAVRAGAAPALPGGGLPGDGLGSGAGENSSPEAMAAAIAQAQAHLAQAKASAAGGAAPEPAQ